MYKLDLYNNHEGMLLATMFGNTPKDAISEMSSFLSQAPHRFWVSKYEMRLINKDGFLVTNFFADQPISTLRLLQDHIIKFWYKEDKNMKYLAMFFNSAYTYIGGQTFESFNEAIKQITKNPDDYFTCVPIESETGVTILTQRLNRMVHIIRMSPDKVETITKSIEPSPVSGETLALLTLDQLRDVAREFSYLAEASDKFSAEFSKKLMRLLIVDIVRSNQYEE